MEILFRLIVAHAFADFVFQTDVMAKGKNRHRKTEAPPGAKYFPAWGYWLTAHSLIHGGMVYLVTDLWWLGLIETILHWIIDFCKCENWINLHQDQALHISCKIMYLAYLV